MRGFTGVPAWVSIRRVLMLALLAVPLVLPACGGGDRAGERAAEKQAEAMLKQATGKDVDIDLEKGGAKVRVEGEGVSAQLAETSEWPSGMFDGVPRFEHGKVTHVTSTEESGQAVFNVFLTDIDGSGVQHYAEQLRTGGWKVDVMQMGPKGSMVNGEKGNLGISLVYNAERKDGMLAVTRR